MTITLDGSPLTIEKFVAARFPRVYTGEKDGREMRSDPQACETPGYGPPIGTMFSAPASSHKFRQQRNCRHNPNF